jgi:stage V sporulation protein AC
MIALGVSLTAGGIYDEIGRFGGMGSALPITGFANSIAAPALEYKREGFVLGVGAKMFTVAGPVLVYGTITAIIVAALRWLLVGIS